MNEEKPFFYANAMEVATSAYDLNLKFLRTGTVTVIRNQATATPEMRQAQVEVRAEISVVMSPQHAKAMLPSLILAIENYEKMFGPLPSAETLRTAIQLPGSGAH